MSNTVMTTCGEVRGTTCQWDGIVAYKGIRYATAGRWEYPKQVTHWEGVYDATIGDMQTSLTVGRDGSLRVGYSKICGEVMVEIK